MTQRAKPAFSLLGMPWWGVTLFTAGVLLAGVLCAGGVFADPPTRIHLTPEDLHFERIGVTHTVEVRLENVENLIAADIYLEFDPAHVQVIDALPSVEGVQIERGEFFQGDFAINRVDNAAGLITYSVVNLDSKTISGTGVFARVMFEAVGPGTSVISVITATDGLTRTGLYAPGVPDPVYIPFAYNNVPLTAIGHVFLPALPKGPTPPLPPTQPPTPTFTATPTPTQTPEPTPTYTATPTVTPTSLPDLYLSSVRTTLAGYQGGCAPALTPLVTEICVGNSGNADADAFRVVLSECLSPPETLSIVGLRAGETLCVVSGRPGLSACTVLVDALDEVPEGNEDNNIWRGFLPAPTPPPICTTTPTNTPTMTPTPTETATVFPTSTPTPSV